jgi:hypothetical protein
LEFTSHGLYESPKHRSFPPSCVSANLRVMLCALWYIARDKCIPQID